MRRALGQGFGRIFWAIAIAYIFAGAIGVLARGKLLH
jgi:hypothetical protein